MVHADMDRHRPYVRVMCGGKGSHCLRTYLSQSNAGSAIRGTRDSEKYTH